MGSGLWVEDELEAVGRYEHLGFKDMSNGLSELLQHCGGRADMLIAYEQDIRALVRLIRLAVADE